MAESSADVMSPGQLRRRRQIWFWATLPIALVFILIGVGGVFMFVGGKVARDAFVDGEYASSQSTWRLLAHQRVVEQWRAPFGQGTAALAQEDYQRALRDLGRAYRETPPLSDDVANRPESAAEPRCMVANNLALAFEGSANTYVELAEQEVAQADLVDDPSQYLDAAISWYERAIEDYDSALSVRTQDGCVDDPDAQTRAEDKRQAAQEALDELRDPPSNDSNSSDDNEQPSDPEDQTPDSQEPDDSDSTGDSDANGGDPNDDPSESDDDGSSNGGSSAEPDDSQSSEPGSSADSEDDSDELSDQELQRREELYQRQREAQEQAERERAETGRQQAPQRRW